jgi:hypothetical protein
MNDLRGIHRRLAIVVTEQLTKRFWSKVNRRGPDECWPWIGALRNGYGCIKHAKAVYSAHRVAFVLTNGEPAEGHVVQHTCDNKYCCNPAHLIADTPAKNNRDARRIPRMDAIGEHAYNAVLSEDIVRQIWDIERELGLGFRAIAARLRISECATSAVLSGIAWKHLIPEWAARRLEARKASGLKGPARRNADLELRTRTPASQPGGDLAAKQLASTLSQ